MDPILFLRLRPGETYGPAHRSGKIEIARKIPPPKFFLDSRSLIVLEKENPIFLQMKRN